MKYVWIMQLVEWGEIATEQASIAKVRSQHFNTKYRNIVDPAFTSPSQTIETF